MSIPPRFLDEIRSRLTLSDVIGKRVRVTRAGREFKACCPFHHEKSPSFTINDDKQFYHCFGCGAHGDVIGFVMQHDNLSFMDAVEALSVDAGLQMPKPDPRAVEQSRKEKGLHELMDATTKWFQAQLSNPANKDVLGYLDGRGLGEEARSQFRIGFAPADGQAIRTHLKGEGFTEEMMLEAGVLKESSKGGQSYAFFRDRVIFPVADRRGRVVAFGGRILPEHIRPITGDFKPPKYINSSDTPLFDKGRMLYGESFARQAAREGHTLIVTEGYMDVIACNMAGFKGAVAPMGTALTEEQILTLWAIMGEDGKTPVLSFDGDNAGRRAASRACARILPLLKPGKSARFAFLPEGEDPDSLLRGRGKQGLQAILAASLSLFDFIWASHTAGRTFETPEERAGLTQALNNEVAAIADQEIQKYYREQIKTRINETFFKPQAQRGKKPWENKANPVNALKIRSPQKAANAMIEKIMLAAIINNPALYRFLDEEFGHFDVQNPRLDALRQKTIMLLEAGLHDEQALDAAALQNTLKTQGFTQEVGDILNESVYVHASFCRPEGAIAIGEMECAAQWRSLRDRLLHQSQNMEIKQGWMKAFENANEEEENKLRDMVRLKALEDR
jgi:DNA primase